MSRRAQTDSRKLEAIETAVDKIAIALGPGDPRVEAIGNSRSSDAIRALAHAVLRDGTLDSRILGLALWLARVLPDQSMVPDVVKLLVQRPEVAILAGDALAQIGSESDLSELGDILVDSSAAVECRRGAARALTQWRDSRVGAILTGALHLARENELVQSEIIQALSLAEMLGHARNTVEELRSCLRSPSPDVRYSALLAMGNLHAVGAMQDIEDLVDDPGVTSRGEMVKREARRVIKKLRTEPRDDP